VTTGPVAALSARFLPAVDRRVVRATGGRFTPSAWVTGLPVVELTTTGARSGAARTARVLAVPVQDGLLVVGANFGSTRDPAWVHNLRAHPRATVNGAAHEARELHDDQRDEGFALAARLNPGWQRFAERAGERPIPVFRLAS
jgi:deazaflavin-dependent oxidoreductase (nitroreductase family)